MGLTILADLVQATGLSGVELQQEIAMLLFAKDKLTLAQASRLAGMSRIEFRRLL